MERPRIRHIALNVQDRDKEAEYYKRVFGLEEKHRGPNGPSRAAMAALLEMPTTICPSSAISEASTYRQWAATSRGPRKSLANK